MSDSFYSLQQLADHLGAELRGDPDCHIAGLNTLQDAVPGELAFLANPAYQKYLSTTQASAVIIHPKQLDDYDGNALVLDNPYLGYAYVTALFAPCGPQAGEIHPSAVVDPKAEIDATAVISANAVIEAGAVIGANVIVGAGSVVGSDVIIGSGSRLYANVTLYPGVQVGESCTLHSGCVIGADGFGFAPGPDGWVKIHQLGRVQLGDRVEVGACTTIDRGALGDTIIGNDVILDNLVQIAHNVNIGDGTAIAGCTGIAGSTTIGKKCTIAGGVGIVGHITVADGVHVTGMTMVSKSISVPGSYSSGTGMDKTATWRKNAARFAGLDRLAKRLAALEKKTDN